MSLITIRRHAFQRQNATCYYCHKPMWLANPERFAQKFNLSLRQTRLFQCTAEHLIAKKDGGEDSEANIVAACQFCNSTRHKNRAKDLSFMEYRVHVQKRIGKGKWPTHSMLNSG